MPNQTFEAYLALDDRKPAIMTRLFRNELRSEGDAITPPSNNVSVLIVEDEGIVALDIQDRLVRLGYRVCSRAVSGQEAIEQAAAHKPDLILMDIRLQGAMDGIQAANTIRSFMSIPIIYLTAYADRETLQRAKITEPHGYLIKPFEERELFISINVSRRQLTSPGFAARVARMLDSADLEARWLTLEITESTLMQNVEVAASVLEELRRMGVRLAIDDFGTGYSSLSVLRGLPIDRIKIDRSFIIDLTESDDARAMIEAMLALGRSLRMTTIAEGIELSEQAELLLRLGCSEGQGYLFARPMSASQLRQSLVNPPDKS